ncbi:hypothetical protein CesoFtcFv8_025585 [Champsocephalus esox]|uniref:Uncharacterized protein n=1 Tax=Champsocephalus esox TaxID=159716 RepID=A0AAN8GFA6_9TELE|nr:hypothetical protein CesoFtcFv8_025585 [Champsocephalus esox]
MICYSEVFWCSCRRDTWKNVTIAFLSPDLGTSYQPTERNIHNIWIILPVPCRFLQQEMTKSQVHLLNICPPPQEILHNPTTLPISSRRSRRPAICPHSCC